MATSTITSVNSTTTSTALLAAVPTRSSVTIVNTDANRMYWVYGSTAATSTAGGFTDYLNQDDTLVLDGDEAKLAIQAIWLADGSGAASITTITTEQLSGAGATSILGMIQEASRRIGLEIPDAVFSATDRTALELKETANNALNMIQRAHRWQKLVQRATYTGDGSTEDFDLPDDYGWMPDDQQVWSSAIKNPLSRVNSLNDWLGMDVQSFNPGTNAWTIYGQQMHIIPALASTVTAQHYYQSTAAVAPVTGTNKSKFTLDTDTFRIDDELFKRAFIYLWKQDKGLPYSEFMTDYENLKEKLISRDKGASVLRIGTARIPRGVNIAYPLNVPTS